VLRTSSRIFRAKRCCFMVSVTECAAGVEGYDNFPFAAGMNSRCVDDHRSIRSAAVYFFHPSAHFLFTDFRTTEVPHTRSINSAKPQLLADHNPRSRLVRLFFGIIIEFPVTSSGGGRGGEVGRARCCGGGRGGVSYAGKGEALMGKVSSRL
jgi:hypothetical protein